MDHIEQLSRIAYAKKSNWEEDTKQLYACKGFVPSWELEEILERDKNQARVREKFKEEKSETNDDCKKAVSMSAVKYTLLWQDVHLLNDFGKHILNTSNTYCRLLAWWPTPNMPQ